jgi:2-hydroxychromene-2-carboxylate isomerase
VAGVAFYFDLGSPYAYLSAERMETALREPVEWRPILLGGLFKAHGRGSWGRTDDREAGMAEVERRAARYGLPAVRWPGPWPADYLGLMRACTFAFAVGVGREFALEAFRSAFQRGADLSIADNVFDVAKVAGLDRDAVAGATQDPAVKQALRDATDAALARGVLGVPTIAVGDRLFWGDDRLQDAAAELQESSAA